MRPLGGFGRLGALCFLLSARNGGAFSVVPTPGYHAGHLPTTARDHHVGSAGRQRPFEKADRCISIRSGSRRRSSSTTSRPSPGLTLRSATEEAASAVSSDGARSSRQVGATCENGADVPSACGGGYKPNDAQGARRTQQLNMNERRSISVDEPYLR